MIPKKIHYIWFGPHEISLITEQCIESWRKYAPGFEIIKWTESDFLDDKRIQKLLQKKQWAFASDIARLIVLKKHGGIYVDTDMELIQDINGLIDYPAFLGFESEELVANGIMGAEKNHWLVEQAYNISCSQFDKKGFMDVSPVIITNALKIRYQPVVGLKHDVMLYSEEVFYPYNPFDKSRPIPQLLFSLIKDNTLGIHHYQKGWKRSFLQRLYIYMVAKINVLTKK